MEKIEGHQATKLEDYCSRIEKFILKFKKKFELIDHCVQTQKISSKIKYSDFRETALSKIILDIEDYFKDLVDQVVEEIERLLGGDKEKPFESNYHQLLSSHGLISHSSEDLEDDSVGKEDGLEDEESPPKEQNLAKKSRNEGRDYDGHFSSLSKFMILPTGRSSIEIMDRLSRGESMNFSQREENSNSAKIREFERDEDQTASDVIKNQDGVKDNSEKNNQKSLQSFKSENSRRKGEDVESSPQKHFEGGKTESREQTLPNTDQALLIEKEETKRIVVKSAEELKKRIHLQINKLTFPETKKEGQLISKIKEKNKFK